MCRQLALHSVAAVDTCPHHWLPCVGTHRFLRRAHIYCPQTLVKHCSLLLACLGALLVWEPCSADTPLDDGAPETHVCVCWGCQLVLLCECCVAVSAVLLWLHLWLLPAPRRAAGLS